MRRQAETPPLVISPPTNSQYPSHGVCIKQLALLLGDANSVTFPFRWIHAPFGTFDCVICHEAAVEIALIYILQCPGLMNWS